MFRTVKLGSATYLLLFSLQDVEIKKMSGNATYGFVLFYDLMDAVRAKQCMDGDLIRGNKIRVCVCVCVCVYMYVCVIGCTCMCTPRYSQAQHCHRLSYRTPLEFSKFRCSEVASQA